VGQRCRGAEDPETGILWAPLFYGWQDNPFNALPFISDIARDRFEKTIGDPDGGGDDEEPWLLEEFGVTLEQLYWRRVTKRPGVPGQARDLPPGAPGDPEQAFIGSGNPSSPRSSCRRRSRRPSARPSPSPACCAAPTGQERKTRAGTIMVPAEGAKWVPEAEINEQDVDLWGMRERLLVWEHPVNEARRGKPEPSASPTASTSRSQTSRRAGRRPRSATTARSRCIDHISRMQVARYRSRIAIHDYPLVVLLIAHLLQPGDPRARGHRPRHRRRRRAREGLPLPAVPAPALRRRPARRRPRAAAGLADRHAHEAADGDDVRHRR
jgi:hypothetical protein